MVRGGDGAVSHIDLPLGHPLAELLGCEINQGDVLGQIEQGIRHGLTDLDAGDLRDGVLAAFDVLDIKRRKDVDACIEQFQHVLVALRMAAAGSVGVREFIHEDEARMPHEKRVEVHFLQCCPAIGH